MARPLFKFTPVIVRHEGIPTDENKYSEVVRETLGLAPKEVTSDSSVRHQRRYIEDDSESAIDYREDSNDKGNKVVQNWNYPEFLENLIAMIPANIIVIWGVIISLFEAFQISQSVAQISFFALTIGTLPWIYVSIEKAEIQTRNAFYMALFQCIAGAGAFVVYATYIDSATIGGLLPWTLTTGHAFLAVVGYTFGIPTLAILYEMYNHWERLPKSADPVA